MADLKEDAISYTTELTVQELVVLIQKAVKLTKAQVTPLDVDTDPGYVAPSIAVALAGHNFGNGPRQWCVQVAVYNMGDYRAVDLIALGDSFGNAVFSGISGYYDLRDGKQRRDRILTILTENDLTAKRGDYRKRDEPTKEQPAAEPAKKQDRADTAESRQDHFGGGFNQGAHRRPAVSPDGVDPMKSRCYRGMLQLSDKLKAGRLEKNGFTRTAAHLTQNLCKAFAEAHMDVNCRDELFALYAAAQEEDSEERFIYQPYLDRYRGQSMQDVAKRAANTLAEYARTHKQDFDTNLLAGGLAVIINDRKSANSYFYQCLILETEGIEGKKIRAWAYNAAVSGFEKWYLDAYGGDAADTAVEEQADTGEQSTDMSPIIGATEAATSYSSADTQTGNDRTSFQEKKTDRRGRKKYMPLIVILASVAAGIILAVCYIQFSGGQTASTTDSYADGNGSGVDSGNEVNDNSEAYDFDNTDNSEENDVDDDVPDAYTENGIHRYDLIVEDVTWSQAFTSAKEMGGYLAHINTEEEFNAIQDQIVSEGKVNINFYLGARRDDDSTNYYWVDENDTLYGDPINSSDYWVESHWYKNEPSYKDGDTTEDVLEIFSLDKQLPYYFNDVPDDILGTLDESQAQYFQGRLGYIVEYDS